MDITARTKRAFPDKTETKKQNKPLDDNETSNGRSDLGTLLRNDFFGLSFSLKS